MKPWKRGIRNVEPYVPGEQPKDINVIKLNTNENPYPPSSLVKAVMQDLDFDKMRLYPDPAATQLVGGIARAYGLDSSQVFVGVGSDDVLAMAFQTFFNNEEPILFPDITYSFYDVWAQLFRIPYRQVPLDDSFRIRPVDYMPAPGEKNGGIIFPNPNAPTGVCESLETIEEIIAGNPDCVVIVDEAYVDFGAQSALPLIEKYDNLLVVQTFSKSRSMAGMRIGYAMGNPELISYLNDVKYSFNSYTMSRAAIGAGAAAIADQAYFESACAKIIATRERVKGELSDLGFTFPDSKANFLFITHPVWKARELFEALKEARIYVRYFDKPRIDNYLRVTIGTDAQMDALLDFLRKY